MCVCLCVDGPRLHIARAWRSARIVTVGPIAMNLRRILRFVQLVAVSASLLISFAVSSSLPECCSFLNEPTDLIHCVTNNSTALMTPDRNPSDIAFVVYASENIYDYASLTLLINSYYAEHRGYSIQFLHDGTASDFFPQDRRWNKIGSVIEALNPENGWAKDVNILVAIDADLIVMDLSFDIASVVGHNRKADIFMSSDPSDVGNTGFIVVRNTKWAYRFFQTWWETRYSFDCDQHALNDLYTKILQTKKSREKISILPAGAINSEFPVYSTFNDSSKVLHMVGEHNEIRYEVFSRAARGLCRGFGDADEDEDEENSSAESVHSLQRYGLTRAVLADSAEGYITTLLERQYRECSGLVYAAPPAAAMQKLAKDEQEAIVTDVDNCLQKLHEVSTQLCGYHRGIMVGREHRCIDIYDDNYKLAEKSGHMIPAALAYMVEHTTKNLYDSLLLGGTSQASIDKGEKIVDILDRARREYLANAPVAQLYALLYKQSMVLFEIAEMCSRMGLAPRALDLTRKALSKNLEMGEIPPSHMDYESLLAGRIRIYDLLAMYLHYAGVKDESIDMSSKAVALAELLYQSSAKEQTKIGDHLIRSLVNHVQLMDAGPELLQYVHRIRELSMQLGFGISDDLATMLGQQERRATIKKFEL